MENVPNEQFNSISNQENQETLNKHYQSLLKEHNGLLTLSRNLSTRSNVDPQFSPTYSKRYEKLNTDRHNVHLELLKAAEALGKSPADVATDLLLLNDNLEEFNMEASLVFIEKQPEYYYSSLTFLGKQEARSEDDQEYCYERLQDCQPLLPDEVAIIFASSVNFAIDKDSKVTGSFDENLDRMELTFSSAFPEKMKAIEKIYTDHPELVRPFAFAPHFYRHEDEHQYGIAVKKGELQKVVDLMVANREKYWISPDKNTTNDSIKYPMTVTEYQKRCLFEFEEGKSIPKKLLPAYDSNKMSAKQRGIIEPQKLEGNFLLAYFKNLWGSSLDDLNVQLKQLKADKVYGHIIEKIEEEAFHNSWHDYQGAAILGMKEHPKKDIETKGPALRELVTEDMISDLNEISNLIPRVDKHRGKQPKIFTNIKNAGGLMNWLKKNNSEMLAPDSYSLSQEEIGRRLNKFGKTLKDIKKQLQKVLR